MKAARKKGRRYSTGKRHAHRMLRVNVRAPNVRVTTPAPHVSVNTPIPTVQIEAPKPLVIPAPIVQVDVEKEESAEDASLYALRKELRKCKKENQIVELILTTDLGPEGRDYRRGTLVRVDEGMIELHSCASLPNNGQSILIPLNRIVAIIPNLQLPAMETAPEQPTMGEAVPFSLVERTGERHDRHLASG